MIKPDSPARLGFGPFEVDGAAGELRKYGVRVRLSAQPFQILLVLLAHPGEIVTREQLREQIWGQGTFVDFEHGLSAAMNKLRRALGDSAGNPRYIETVPGRGYRFLGVLQEENARRSAAVELPPVAGLKPRRKIWFIAVAASVAVLFAAGFFYLHRTPPGTGKLTSKDKIVLADFTNTTGDSLFDDTLRQGMAVELEQSPFLSLVSDDRIQQVLPMMNQQANARLTPGLAREVCERTGGAAILQGSISRLGTKYVLWLRAKNCMTGDILDEEQAQAANKEDVLDALSRMARKFRTRSGESLAALEKHSVPLAEATTPSFDALKAYSSARKVAFSIGFSAAVPHLKRAIELDPKFAMAYAYLGRIYGDIGESVLSAESTTRAYQLRQRTSDREKFFITFSYDRQVTGNLEKAGQTAESWAQTYHREPDAHSLLSGFATQGAGQYEKSIKEAKLAIAIDPDCVPGFANLAFAYLFLDQIAESENTLRLAAARNLEIPDYSVLRFYLAFLKSDQLGMEREVALARGRSGAEDWISHHQALVLARSGRIREARVMSRRAVELAVHMDARERASTYEAGAAVYEAFAGYAAEARRHAKAALRLSQGRDIEYSAAFALALSGDLAGSKELATSLDKQFPEDTAVRFEYLPVLRARLALARGDCSQALGVLLAAVPYDFALPGAAFFGFFGGLYPAYVRGEAYLAAHRGNEAIDEFHKVLDHRGIVFSDPIGALAHWQLGRAYVLAGEKTRAKSAYQDFLSLWKDADPDIPILNQARAEYAKLQ